MGEPIHVELTRTCDGRELLEFLREHGFSGELVEAGDHVELEVAYAQDEEERLRGDVWTAVTTWLSEQERPLVPAPADERTFVLRPPGD